MSLCTRNSPKLMLGGLVAFNPEWRLWVRRIPLLWRSINASDFKAV
jgi:hypothetical protein